MWSTLQQRQTQGESLRCGLVIAHPDDETMFFAPALRAVLRLPSAELYVLCLSTGELLCVEPYRSPCSAAVRSLLRRNLRSPKCLDLLQATTMGWVLHEQWS
jgi:GlcNAc-PI de-N-acetylase